MNRIGKLTDVGASARLALVSALIALSSPAADLPLVPQRVKLYAGWNLFHLSVTPREGANEIFGKFPVLKGVAMYDAESFLRTPQVTSGARPRVSTTRP